MKVARQSNIDFDLQIPSEKYELVNCIIGSSAFCEDRARIDSWTQRNRRKILFQWRNFRSDHSVGCMISLQSRFCASRIVLGKSIPMTSKRVLYVLGNCTSDGTASSWIVAVLGS